MPIDNSRWDGWTLTFDQAGYKLDASNDDLQWVVDRWSNRFIGSSIGSAAKVDLCLRERAAHQGASAIASLDLDELTAPRAARLVFRRGTAVADPPECPPQRSGLPRVVFCEALHRERRCGRLGAWAAEVSRPSVVG